MIITTVVGGAIILALLLCTVFVLISHARGDVPFFGSHSVMWITTGSMEPTIPQRSYILIEKVQPQDISRGDVIVFISDDPDIAGQYNTHRVISVIGDYEAFVTRGDNPETNPAEDRYPARAENLIGRCVKVLPALTLMGRFLSSTVGLFAMGVLIVTILMVMYLPDMARVMKQAEMAKREKEARMDELVRLEVERLKENAEKEKEEGEE